MIKIWSSVLKTKKLKGIKLNSSIFNHDKLFHHFLLIFFIYLHFKFQRKDIKIDSNDKFCTVLHLAGTHSCHWYWINCCHFNRKQFTQNQYIFEMENDQCNIKLTGRNCTCTVLHSSLLSKNYTGGYRKQNESCNLVHTINLNWNHASKLSRNSWISCIIKTW